MRGVVPFEERVLAALDGLRPGQVATYGEIAAAAGAPGAARAVGSLLARGPVGVAWWRVVRADGALAAPHRAEQARRLAAEGVLVVDGRVSVRGRAAR